jgi:DNA repair protein RecO (recombination protein O)
MEWTEDGIVLGARKHGESAVIITVLTRDHGRHAGLVRGGAGRRARGIYQPANVVSAHWSARLSEHLGTFRCELLKARAAEYLQDPLRLAALSAATSTVDAVLPEREPHPLVFDALEGLLANLDADDWCARYVRWEYLLLGELGFGLDLGEALALRQNGVNGGAHGGSMFVTARSGEAVTDPEAASDRGEKVLSLPAFMLGDGGIAADAADIRAGLALTGHFLTQRVFQPDHRKLPAARDRLVAGLGTGPVAGLVGDGA